MYTVIIFSHGDFSKGILNSAELILGDQQDVFAFSVQENCDLDSLKSEIETLLISCEKQGKDVVFLTDLFFGSPFNIVNSLMQTYHFEHVTGMNLPLLIEILSQRNHKSIKETLESSIPISKDSIIDCIKYFQSNL